MLSTCNIALVQPTLPPRCKTDTMIVYHPTTANYRASATLHYKLCKRRQATVVEFYDSCLLYDMTLNTSPTQGSRVMIPSYDLLPHQHVVSRGQSQSQRTERASRVTVNRRIRRQTIGKASKLGKPWCRTAVACTGSIVGLARGGTPLLVVGKYEPSM